MGWSVEERKGVGGIDWIGGGGLGFFGKWGRVYWRGLILEKEGEIERGVEWKWKIGCKREKKRGKMKKRRIRNT